MEIRRVGVVGCGLMGGGIAQVCAQTGYAVLVSEINEELLRRGLAGITASLDKAGSENPLLATNPPCLSVTEMARATGRPDKVLGLHFFNPVPAMKLLEVI